jgi:5'-methylthioadenosine phosphorylase
MPKRIAFMSGTSIAKSDLFSDWTERKLESVHGAAIVREKNGLILMNRHGPNYLPPHAINFRANIQVLADLGVDTVVSLNSVGSLKEDLPPGTIVSCSDYVCFTPSTFSDTELRAMGPVVANNLIPQITAALPYPVPGDKVYVQMRGPRFETRAEIRIVRHWGDVIGMTMASEADLCQEAGIAYNSLCIIDNYANGIAGSELSQERFRELVLQNQQKVNDLFRTLIGLYS